MFWKFYLAFKKNSTELTRIGALFSSLLKLGILPGERALRKAATRLCIFYCYFWKSGFSLPLAFLMISLLASEDHMWLK